MRPCFLALATLLAATTVASAEPAPALTSYVQSGVEAGGNDGYFTGGVTIEAGTQVVPGVGVHVIGTHGGAEELFSSGTGRYTQVRGGFDVSGCPMSKSRCVFAGVDFGVQHTHWSGIEGTFFDDNGTPATHDRVRPIGVGRVGLDIGGAHIRWRPSLELAFSDTGANGANVMQSLAYRF